MPIVETSSLAKSYSAGLFKKSSIRALEDVTLSVHQGEIFGLLGPNGAGKTTFVKILLSIVFPTTGSVSIFGKPLGSPDIRRQIGYLPENHRYPGFLTAFDTLLHFGRLQGMPTSSLRGHAKKLLGLVGLTDWENVKVKKFSKGMLQRLGLAQAMLNDPQILFLDEPTDGVDPVGRKEIRDILSSLRNIGKTVFLNSHMLSEVEEISNRVAILNKGRLLYVGTIADMTTERPAYEIRLHQAPSEAVLASVRPLCESLEHDQSLLRITVAERGDFQRILDTLRQQQCEIESFAPHKSRLEDHFINLIKTGTA